MLSITPAIALDESEVVMHAMAAQGAGGQNVNKVATAIHLRFDIHASSLPDEFKERLLQLRDRRISAQGIIVIKAQRYRVQEKNRLDALQRLVELLRQGLEQKPKRTATRPSRASKERRLEHKNRRGQTKNLRKKVTL